MPGPRSQKMPSVGKKMSLEEARKRKQEKGWVPPSFETVKGSAVRRTMKTKLDLIDWYEAGLIGETSTRPDRPLDGGFLLPNLKIQLREEWLVWNVDDGAEREIVRREPPGILYEFVQLDKPADVLRFAQRYSIIGFCGHALPYTHPSRLRVPGSSSIRLRLPTPIDLSPFPKSWLLARIGRCWPLGWEGDTPPFVGFSGDCYEPIGPWLHFARQARAILNVAAQLYLHRCGSESDWQQIHKGDWQDFRSWRDNASGLSIERHLLTDIVNSWLIIAGVCVGLERSALKSNSLAQLVVDTDGIFGEIAYQLALAVSQSRGLVCCSECATPYVPDRLPNPGQDHYCKTCGTLAARRAASKRYRDKRRRAQISEER